MTLRTTISTLFGCAALAILLACGSSTPPPPASVGVSISPTTASVVVSTNQTFTASVTNSTNTAVTWAVQEGATGGTITAGGVYTAPATVGTYHVVVTSVADTTKSATAVVTVTPVPPVTVTVSPATQSLVTGGTQTFTATVANATNTAVTWTVQEGASGGSITTGGLYTAPLSIGTYHVVATSVADNTKSGSATVTVTLAPATTLSYTDPTTGMYRLVRNPVSSTSTHLVLDLTGVGAPVGAGIAFTFTVDTAGATWSKVTASDTDYIQNGTVLTLGSAPLALTGKVATTTLIGALGLKGTSSSVALNGVLARVALDLKSGAAPGVVTLASPKAQVLASDGSISMVSITLGTVTAN